MASSQINTRIGEKRDVAPWLTCRTYFPDTEVSISDSVYICLIEHISTVFVTDLAAGNWLLIGGAAGASAVLITDAGIIATITNGANWNVDGDYTGSTAGLISGNYYYDDTWNQYYKFDVTTLIRITYNTFT